MIIVIDAYNVLKQVLAKQEVSDKERNTFIGQIGRYSKKKQHKAIVVFDGGPYEWVHKEKMNGLIIMYSGVHESADDVIKHYIEDHYTKELLLVSTDREINAVAARFDVPSINSKDFFALVRHALHEEPQMDKEFHGNMVKISQDDDQVIDELMREASDFVPIKEEDVVMEVYSRMRSAHAEGKGNKKLLRVLKKL